MNFDDIARRPCGFDAEFFKQLPKSDLHCHLDGSLRIDTILDLASNDHVDLGVSSKEGLDALIQPGKIHDSLEAYLIGFGTTLKVLQNEAALARVAYELAQDAAAENVMYLEVRFSPILHQDKGLHMGAIIEAVVDGLDRAKRDFGIQSGTIICGIRNISPTVSLRLAELAVAYKNRGVVAFDLAGAEYNNPAKEHIDAFNLILKNNVNVTIHAGEAFGPESVHQALHYCGAHRIGHGTRLREDGDLLNYVNDHRVPLEMCLSSNIQTQTVKSMDRHPFQFYLDLGVRVTLNTDNRLITQTDMTREFRLAHETFGLLPQDILDITVNGVKSAFLPFDTKRRLIRSTKEKVKAMLISQCEKHCRAED